MISNVYHYYLKTYANKPGNRFDSHKKSDLRMVYNNMVRLNKKTPLYKVDLSQDTQRFAIDLKEGIREFKSIILNLSNYKEEGSPFLNKTAYSSNESILKAEYIAGDQLYIDEDQSFEISVKQLASPQINTGDFLPSNSMALSPGEYSFDIVVGNSSYEFQYKINENTTNLQLQNRLSRLINQSNIGLRADVIMDNNGSSALELLSIKSGVFEFRPYTFKVSESKTNKANGSVEYFGLNKVSSKPTNAKFTINGLESTSASNSFIIENTFSISLKNISKEGETAIVGLLKSSDSALNDIQTLVDGYNTLYNIGKNKDYESITNRIFLNELNAISKRHQDSLQTAGIIIQADGNLKIDENTLTDSVNNGSYQEGRDKLYDFQNSLIRHLEQLSLDPLKYINKKLIAYPNPVRSYINPYQTSIYSGMIFNGYL